MVYSGGRSRMLISWGMCPVVCTIFGIFVYTVFIYSEYFKPIWKHNHVRSHDSTLLSVFSAVVHIEEENKITLNVWDGSSDMNYKCCILISNTQLVQVFAEPLNTSYDENVISARQYRCSLSSSKMHGISVAMISTSKKCAMTEQFTNVVYPPIGLSNRFVIYSVLTQEVRPLQLVEWVEYYKSTGVDMIYLVLQLPDAQVTTVLSYYLTNGFLEIKEFPFPLPGRSQDDIDRNFATANNDSVRRQLDQDRRVAMFHCTDYLRGFGYVANIDVNEFIVTKDWRMLYHFLEETFVEKYPDAASVRLKYVHNGRYQSNHQGNYDSEHIKYKTIHIPGRVLITSGNLVIPKANYDVYTIPEDRGVVFHIRHCSAMWILCVKDRSPTTVKLYQSRTNLERKCLTVASKLHLGTHNVK